MLLGRFYSSLTVIQNIKLSIMKLKFIRWIGLILGSILSIIIANLAAFGGGHIIGSIRDGDGLTIDNVGWLLYLLSAILIIVGVIIAWFNTRLGGLLITAMGMIELIAFYDSDFWWVQLSALLVGLILLFYEYYNWSLMKKGEI